MDPGLDPQRHAHLHTEECNIFWQKYLDCKKEHYILKYLDHCWGEEEDMLWCFKKERRRAIKEDIKRSDKIKKKLVERLKAENKDNSQFDSKNTGT